MKHRTHRTLVLCAIIVLTEASAFCGTAEFQPTVANKNSPAGKAPEGMVWIPGGEFSMGAAVSGEGSHEMPMASNDSEPVHRAYVDGFWMDATPVTNAQFEKFVRATNYVTIAERTPTKEEFPTAPEENLVAGAVVFAPTDHEVPLNDHYQWWSYIKGANWRHPFGPQSDIKGKENYPVVQIAYPDAEAYAKWAGKRLPTEAEFEFAARGGLSGKTYVWGDEFHPDGKWMANTWQGEFPVKDAGEDGYAGIAPVKSFPPNGYGFTTWPETFGNGAATGIGLITIKRSQTKAESRAIRRGRIRHWILLSLTRRSESIAAVRFFATSTIVRATSSGHAAKAK